MIHKSPSNIALIKYMGKKTGNIPINPSLSYTLDSLISGVRISQIPEGKKDLWRPLKGNKWLPCVLSPKEQSRFLFFFQTLKKNFHLKNSYLIESANNFPKSLGAASSASSFSALTKAVYHQALKESTFKEKLSALKLSQISRKGSGSSCRSFFKPWCLWEGVEAQSLQLPGWNQLSYELIGDETCKEKTISSSLAHQKIQTSLHFKGRVERAQTRLKIFMSAAQKKQWNCMYETAFEEFEDMHQLFETSEPSFSYISPETRKTLQALKSFWKSEKDGPLITMDAGPCIHLLYRPDQKEIQKEIQKMLLNKIRTPTF